MMKKHFFKICFICLIYGTPMCYGQFNFSKSFSVIINNKAPSVLLGLGLSTPSSGISITSSNFGGGIVNMGISNKSGGSQTTTVKYEVGFTNWTDRLLTSVAAKQSIRDYYLEIYGGWEWAWPRPFMHNALHYSVIASIEALANMPLKRLNDYPKTRVRFAAVMHNLHNPVEYGQYNAAYTYSGGIEVSKWSFIIK
jgi:hypothetical protein